MVKICVPNAVKSIGLTILAFTLGAVIGLICPLKILAIVELLVMAAFGDMCLFMF